MEYEETMSGEQVRPGTGQETDLAPSQRLAGFPRRFVGLPDQGIESARVQPG
jgi:hypothetical protein